MIVDQVEISGLPIFEPEYLPPVARDADAPEALAIAGQWMKAPARKQVHVVNPSRGVQRREQPAQPLCLIRSDTPGPPRFEELPQTFVALIGILSM